MARNQYYNQLHSPVSSWHRSKHDGVALVDLDFLSICPACAKVTEIMVIHGHGQCSFCKTNIDPCCSGETAEREGGSPLKKKIPQNNLQRWKEDTFFALIWVYATSFLLGSKLNLLRFMTSGSASKGYNILFTSSMKRTFCDANKVRLRIIDRTIWRFEFGFSFWVLIRLITFLRGGEVHWREKSITTNYLQEEEEALNELPRKYLQNINNISN